MVQGGDVFCLKFLHGKDGETIRVGAKIKALSGNLKNTFFF